MKTQIRTAVLSCCITLLLLSLVAFSGVAFYNTASVLNNTDEVVAVQKEEGKTFLVWMGQEYLIPTERINQAITRLEEWTPLFPREIRYLWGATQAVNYGVQSFLDFCQGVWTFS